MKKKKMMKREWSIFKMKMREIKGERGYDKHTEKRARVFIFFLFLI